MNDLRHLFRRLWDSRPDLFPPTVLLVGALLFLMFVHYVLGWSV